MLRPGNAILFSCVLFRILLLMMKLSRAASEDTLRHTLSAILIPNELNGTHSPAESAHKNAASIAIVREAESPIPERRSMSSEYNDDK
jgi:hypothetical protein